jgi:hypothetical protein
MFDPLYYLSDLPGFDPATLDEMVLYYQLMDKVDWFRRYYGIFLGGVVTTGIRVIGMHQSLINNLHHKLLNKTCQA